MATKKVATRKRVPVKRAVRPVVKDDFIMPEHHAVPLLLYKRIALAFLMVVGVVLAVVMYLSTMQATIHVRPVAKSFSSSLIVHAVRAPLDESEIHGTVVSGSVSKTKTFEPSGEGAKEVEGKSYGTVVLKNTTNSPQPLVATTRLLSSSNVLFRLQKGVTVPAGGSITAEVVADQPGKSGDIAPTRFSIPGLAAAKQALIYAESTAPFTGGVQTMAVVSAQELQGSVDALKEELTNEAKEMLRTQAGNGFDGELFTAQVVSQKTSIQPDTESKAYEVSVTAVVTGVFYDKTALTQVFTRHLYNGLGQGQDFAPGTSIDQAVLSVEQFDVAQNVASIHVQLDGKTIITRTNKALDVGRFVGMKSEDVSRLLTADGVAESVKVDFFPFWLTKIPRLKDHVSVEFDTALTE